MSENLEDDEILNMSEAELDRHLRANGIDPDGLLPGLVKHLKLKLEEDLPDRSRINLLTALVSIQSQQIPQLQKDWTPISEGLPEYSGDYLVQLQNGKTRVAMFESKPGMEPRFTLPYAEHSHSDVIAYRPLPPAYEGEGK